MISVSFKKKYLQDASNRKMQLFSFRLRSLYVASVSCCSNQLYLSVDPTKYSGLFFDSKSTLEKNNGGVSMPDVLHCTICKIREGYIYLTRHITKQVLECTCTCTRCLCHMCVLIHQWVWTSQVQLRTSCRRVV